MISFRRQRDKGATIILGESPFLLAIKDTIFMVSDIQYSSIPFQRVPELSKELLFYGFFFNLI